jgi:hypothetical protein
MIHSIREIDRDTEKWVFNYRKKHRKKHLGFFLSSIADSAATISRVKGNAPF